LSFGELGGFQGCFWLNPFSPLLANSLAKIWSFDKS